MTTRITVVGVLGLAGFACGDLVPGFYNAPTANGVDRVGFGSPEGGEPPPAVKAKDKASIGLKMASDAQNKAFITNGDVPVERAISTPIGKTVSGTDTIMAQWDEFTGTSTSTIQVVWTTVNGEPFLPIGHKLNGKPAPFVEWRFGATDPVDFMAHITEIKLIAATISWSSDGGTSFQTADIFPFFTLPWKGSDFGKMLGLAGVNYMFTIYEYEVIPAPASLGLLALGGIFACRRRR